MKDEDINLTYRHILGKSCILIIGPDLIVKHGNNEGLFESFIEYLRKEKDNLGLRKVDIDNLYDEDGFFNIDKKYSREYEIIKNSLQRFCESCSENFKTLYRKIAQIPFHLIFFVSPDIALRTALEELGVNNNFYSYNAKESTGNWELTALPKDNTPVLINLIVDYEVENMLVTDMVLSYEDFITLIAGLYGHNQLPSAVQGAIKNAKQIIFLGYRFDKWYAKIICDLFNFPSPHERDVSKYNIAILKKEVVKAEAEVAQPGAEHIRMQPFKFYERQYNTAFEYLDPEEFVDKLYEKFTPAQLRGTAVDDGVNDPPLQSSAKKVLKLLKAGDLVEAIKKLDDVEKSSEDPELRKTILIFKADYGREMRDYRNRGTMSGAESASGIPKEKAKELSDRIIALMAELTQK